MRAEILSFLHKCLKNIDAVKNLADIADMSVKDRNDVKEKIDQCIRLVKMINWIADDNNFKP